jgi:hypothetical protein
MRSSDFEANDPAMILKKDMPFGEVMKDELGDFLATASQERPLIRQS